MRESSGRRVRASKPLKEHLFLKSKLSAYGRAVLGIWPDNAPKVVAERAGISIRNANQIMSGERRVTAGALLVLNEAVIDEENAQRGAARMAGHQGADA